MAHTFAPIPAKPAFGTLRENLYQSDYLERKKAKLVYCNKPTTVCNKPTQLLSYDKYQLYRLGQYARAIEECNIIPVNKGNLIVGQYSKMDLANVITIIPTPVNASSTVPFYQTNVIDPLGQLFGKTQCGELNYTNYMVFYPPTIPLGFS